MYFVSHLRQLHDSILTELGIFFYWWTGFYRFQRIEDNFVGNKISNNLKIGVYAVCHRISQPSCTNFGEVCKKTKVLTLSWSITDALHWILPLIIPIGNSTCLNSMSDFIEGYCNTQCPFNSTRYTASSFSDADQFLEWLTLAHFVFSRTFFYTALL